MANKAIAREGFVAYCDIYGFSAAVTGGDAERISTHLLNTWRGITKRLATQEGTIAVAFSDSLFIIVPVTESQPHDAALTIMLRALRHTLDTAIQAGFLLRGAVAFGTYVRAQSVFGGQAVIVAHSTESMISAPLVFLPQTLLDSIENSHLASELRVQLVPIKGRNGERLMVYPVLPDSYDDYRSLLQATLDRGSPGRPAAVAAALSTALSTIKLAHESSQWAG